MTIKQYITRWLVTLVGMFAATAVLAPQLAFAGATDDAPVNLTDTLASLRVSALFVQALISLVIPYIVGLLTTWKDHPFVKGLLDLVLGAISTLIVQATLADGSAVISEQTFLVWLAGLGSAAIAYAKGWKPAGLTSSAIQIPGGPPGSTISVPGKLSGHGLRKA